MDPVILTIIIKGLATLGLIGGGLMALRYGFRLYMDGTGAKKDSYALQVSSLKLKANSVGSVVMATAFAWAWAAVIMSPSLSQNGQNIQVYSFHTPQGEVSSRALVARASANTARNPVQLEELFRETVLRAEKSGDGNVVLMEGRPASLNLTTLKPSSTTIGAFEISAFVKSNGVSSSLTYQPSVFDGKVVFIPAKATTVPKL